MIDTGLGGRYVTFLWIRLDQQRPQIKAAGPQEPKPIGCDLGDKVAVASCQNRDVVAAFSVTSLEDLWAVVVNQGVVVADRPHSL